MEKVGLLMGSRGLFGGLSATNYGLALVEWPESGALLPVSSLGTRAFSLNRFGSYLEPLCVFASPHFWLPLLIAPLVLDSPLVLHRYSSPLFYS